MADAVVIANRANIFWGENKMQWTAQRDRLSAILNGSECIRPASVFDPLSARIAEHLGFELGLFAGSTASLTVLGAPDLVLLTASEFAQQVQRVCRLRARGRRRAFH